MSLQSRIADLITAVGADIKDLRTAKRFRVYAANNLVLGDGATILFNNKSGNGDPNNWFDTATGRFQPTKAGYYRLSAAFSVASGMSSGQYVEIRLFKNSGLLQSIGSRGYWSGASTQANSVVTDVVFLNGTTDYVYCTHAASTARNDTLDGQAWSTHFEGEWIGN